MIHYQWTTTVIALLLGISLLWLVRKAHLHGPYAIWWIAVAIGVAVFGLAPPLVDGLARILGVGYSPILIVVLGICAILVKMLTMDLDRTRQERHVRRLTQRIALLEAALEDERQERGAASGEQASRAVVPSGNTLQSAPLPEQKESVAGDDRAAHERGIDGSRSSQQHD